MNGKFVVPDYADFDSQCSKNCWSAELLPYPLGELRTLGRLYGKDAKGREGGLVGEGSKTRREFGSVLPFGIKKTIS